MAKIYKSFQVKIDKEHPHTIPTGQKLKSEKPKIYRPVDEEEIGKFREVPLDKLTSQAPTGSGKEKPESGSPGIEETPEEEEERYASVIGRASTLLAAANRRSSELNLLEERLKDWERALLEREKYVTVEEEKFHQESMKRRKSIEEEAAKMLEMAKRSSDTIMKTASAEAETMKKSLQIELEEVRTKGYKEGFALGEEKGIAAGEKSGFDEGKMEWTGLIQETETLIKELQSSRMGVLKASEEEMVRLILSFSKRVLKAECMSRPEIILNNIDAAINKLSEVDKIVLRINLRDKSLAESRKDDFLKHLSGVGELKIVEDPSLTPGGIRIETGVGTIDATIESQANELEKVILKILTKAES